MNHLTSHLNNFYDDLNNFYVWQPVALHVFWKLPILSLSFQVHYIWGNLQLLYLILLFFCIHLNQITIEIVNNDVDDVNNLFLDFFPFREYPLTFYNWGQRLYLALVVVYEMLPIVSHVCRLGLHSRHNFRGYRVFRCWSCTYKVCCWGVNLESYSSTLLPDPVFLLLGLPRKEQVAMELPLPCHLLPWKVVYSILSWAKTICSSLKLLIFKYLVMAMSA